MNLNEIQKLSDDDLRVKVAELCGWVPYKRNYQDYNGEPRRWHKADEPERQHDPTDWRLPNYPTDLNAMHEAGKTLIFSRRQRYFKILGDLHPATKERYRVAEAELILSTARQRAEAFILTLSQ